METHIPSQLKPKPIVRKSPKNLISPTPLRVVALVEVLEQESFSVSKYFSFHLIYHQFSLSHVFAFDLQKEREVKRELSCNLLQPLLRLSLNLKKKKAIIQESEEEEGVEEERCLKR